MLKIKNVSKSYNNKINVIDNLNVEIKSGEIFGFLGPNGAGKTTTIKMMTGINGIDNGDILLDGISITDKPIEAKRKFGYVPDSPDLFLRLKGIEYLNFICNIYNVPINIRKNRIKDLAKRFSLEDVLDDRIQSYSHGMRQKIVVIGALMHNPDIWILDEPLTGLDPKSSFELKKMMRQHADNGKTVFFSTHVLEVAEKLCDRVGVINKGKLLFLGTLEEMKKHFKENQTLEKMFLEMTDDE